MKKKQQSEGEREGGDSVVENTRQGEFRLNFPTVRVLHSSRFERHHLIKSDYPRFNGQNVFV